MGFIAAVFGDGVEGLMQRRLFVLNGLMGLAVAGCAAPRQDMSQPSASFAASGGAGEGQVAKIAALGTAIKALSPTIAALEADRIAQIAVRDPLQWAALWDVTDPPLIHNIKVNQGLKPRGLCKEWADDLQKRMATEAFQTVSWHRAIANHDNLRIEHSTLIVSAKGASMREGIVLDPWRQGQGRLYYVKVSEDPKYRWEERQKVFAFKRARKAASNR